MKPFGNLLFRVGQRFLVFILIFSCSYENADLVLTNAKIITLNEEKPQAEIVAIRGDRILHVGQNTSAERYIGEKTKVLDLKGQLVIPGLVESHAHFMGLGYSLLNLDLTWTGNYQETGRWSGLLSRSETEPDAGLEGIYNEWCLCRF